MQTVLAAVRSCQTLQEITYSTFLVFQMLPKTMAAESLTTGDFSSKMHCL